MTAHCVKLCVVEQWMDLSLATSCYFQDLLSGFPDVI